MIATPELCLDTSGLIKLDVKRSRYLLEALIKYGNGSRAAGEDRTLSLPFEVLAPLLCLLVPITDSKTYIVDIETLSAEVVVDAPTTPNSSCDVGESSATKKSQPASVGFQALTNLKPAIEAELSCKAGMIECGLVSAQQQRQHQQWRWSIWQTALLLSLATDLPQTYFSKYAVPWRDLVRSNIVSTLQHELADGIEAAMAAGAAAGKPVGMVQLMEWLGPLFHG